MRKLFLLLLILPYTHLCAEQKVVFFSLYDNHSKPVEFVNNGQFVHVALSFQGGWLSSSPENGVHWSQNFPIDIGTPSALIVDQEAEEISQESADNFLGKSYDYAFNWDDSKRIYCSELIAKLLHIEPTPMTFDTDIWDKSTQKKQAQGNLGISPDEVYEALINRNYQIRELPAPPKKSFCERSLNWVKFLIKP